MTLTPEELAKIEAYVASSCRSDALPSYCDILIAAVRERDAMIAELREALGRIGWHEISFSEAGEIARLALAKLDGTEVSLGLNPPALAKLDGKLEAK